MSTQPLIEKLIEAHLDFLDEQFAQTQVIQQEFEQFYHWLGSRQLQHLWTFEQIQQLIQKQILDTPASDFLIEQIAEHIRFALIHPANETATVEDVIPVLTIDRIAQYVASKEEHRKKLIKTIVNNPAFSALLTQLIQQTMHDYLDESMSKRVPGVGRFMKMGKSVLETVTDSNLDDTINHYLQKNILKLSQMSERVLNQHFDNDKLYHFQANVWHKVKTMPLSVLKNYVETQDLSKTVCLGHEIWDHIRQTDYLKQQVHDGIYTWYVRNQERSFDLLLRDLNIDEGLVQHELTKLLVPVLQQLITTGHLRRRARVYLEKFYYSEKALDILNNKGA
ncbi:hypothetical protein PA3_11500 [Acinetobacter pittii]|uniref:Uncharacterized protein n=1 Tax=Acinetobacter pittii TaxID=48296 RepID=A0A4Y3J6M3_ACIPI|nr:hypothetical protein [Acinetobacter pittii]GEA66992.1 hypothetical protein PA3_11500 [Acinetobacter pittii]